MAVGSNRTHGSIVEICDTREIKMFQSGGEFRNGNKRFIRHFCSFQVQEAEIGQARSDFDQFVADDLAGKIQNSNTGFWADDARVVELFECLEACEIEFDEVISVEAWNELP